MSNLSAKQFQARMQGKDTVIIDVRTPGEFKDGYIPGAVNIDFYEDFDQRIRELDKSGNYLLYCRSGSRSNSALKIMKRSGFNNVSHLDNGIIGWDEPLVRKTDD